MRILHMSRVMKTLGRSADLRNADLAGAVLESVKLQGANLRGAGLWEANLEGTELQGAKGLTLEQVESAQYNDNTKFPPHIEEALGRNKKTT